MPKHLFMDGAGEPKVLAQSSALAEGIEYGASPADLAFGGTAEAGSSDAVARGDHKHGMPALETSITASSTDAGVPSSKAVYDLLGGAPEYASIAFADGADAVFAVMPPNVASFHVFNSYASTGSPALQIALAAGGSAASVSTASGSPTSASAYAGESVKFTITGVAGAVNATFGLKLNKG